MPLIWVDSCVIGDIAGGDRDLELALRLLHATLLIVPKVREELLSGNPLKPGSRPRPPQEIALAQNVIRRLDIQLDMRGSTALRRELFEKNFKFKPGRTVVRAIEELDAIVLSEIAASARDLALARPRLITTDGRLTNNADAKAWGVEITLPDPTLVMQARTRRAQLASATRAMLDSIQSQTDLLSGEHKAQAAIIQTPSVVGFIGFWTNRLFNTDVPPLDIWNPAFQSLTTANRMLRDGDLAQATAMAAQARGNLLKATVVYRRWKDGIELAGAKMQLTIGVVAVALIVAAVGAYAAGLAAATSGADATAAAGSLADLVAKGDGLALRVASEANGPAAEAALREWEAVLEETEKFIERTLVQ